MFEIIHIKFMKIIYNKIYILFISLSAKFISILIQIYGFINFLTLNFFFFLLTSTFLKFHLNKFNLIAFYQNY